MTAGSLPSGVASCTVTVAVKAATTPTESVSFENCGDDFTNQQGVDPAGCGVVSFSTTGLAITKSASTFTAEPGGTVTYEVKATNVGAADYTAENPAHLVDELAGVLDDAGFFGDAQVDGTPIELSGTRLSWSGALAVGATAVLSYSVAVPPQADPAADGVLRNVAFDPGADAAAAAPACDGSDGIDAATGFPCAALEIPVGSAAETTGVLLETSTTFVDEDTFAGDVVTYQFLVTNQGSGALVDVAVTVPLIPTERLSYDWGADGTAGQVAPGGAVVTGQVEEDPDRRLGELVVFSYVATNTGTLTLTGVEIRDSLAGLGPLNYGQWPGDEGVLAPGQEVTAEAVYPLTTEDGRADSVTSVASVSSQTAQGASVTATGGKTVPITFAEVGLRWVGLLVIVLLGALAFVIYALVRRSKKKRRGRRRRRRTRPRRAPRRAPITRPIAPIPARIGRGGRSTTELI